MNIKDQISLLITVFFFGYYAPWSWMLDIYTFHIFPILEICTLLSAKLLVKFFELDWAVMIASGVSVTGTTVWGFMKAKAFVAKKLAERAYSYVTVKVKSAIDWVPEFVQQNWAAILTVAVLAATQYEKVYNFLRRVNVSVEEKKNEAQPQKVRLDANLFYMIFSGVLGTAAAFEQGEVSSFFKSLKDNGYLKGVIETYWTTLVGIVTGEDQDYDRLRKDQIASQINDNNSKILERAQKGENLDVQFALNEKKTKREMEFMSLKEQKMLLEMEKLKADIKKLEGQNLEQSAKRATIGSQERMDWINFKPEDPAAWAALEEEEKKRVSLSEDEQSEKNEAKIEIGESGNESLMEYVADARNWASENSDLFKSILSSFTVGVAGSLLLRQMYLRYIKLTPEGKKRVWIVLFGILFAGLYFLYINKRKVKKAHEAINQDYKDKYTNAAFDKYQDDQDFTLERKQDRLERERDDAWYDSVYRVQDEIANDKDWQDAHWTGNWADYEEELDKETTKRAKSRTMEHHPELFDPNDFRRKGGKNQSECLADWLPAFFPKKNKEELKVLGDDLASGGSGKAQKAVQEAFADWIPSFLKKNEIQYVKLPVNRSANKKLWNYWMKKAQENDKKKMQSAEEKLMKTEALLRSAVLNNECLEATIANLSMTRKSIDQQISNANAIFREHNVDPPRIEIPPSVGKDNTARRIFVAKELQKKAKALVAANPQKYKKIEAACLECTDYLETPEQIQSVLDKLVMYDNEAITPKVVVEVVTAQNNKKIKKTKKPRDDTSLSKKDKNEAPLVGVTPIEQVKFRANWPYILEGGAKSDAKTWQRGVWRTKDRVFTSRHPDAVEGKEYTIAIQQFNNEVVRFPAKVKKLSMEFDLCELEVETQHRARIPNYTIQAPLKGTEVVIHYTPQGHLPTEDERLEKGRVQKIYSDGKFEYDIYTTPGASACPVVNPQHSIIYGWHLHEGEPGKTNTGRYFNDEVLRLFNLN